jgi:hypothetical protein
VSAARQAGALTLSQDEGVRPVTQDDVQTQIEELRRFLEEHSP